MWWRRRDPDPIGHLDFEPGDVQHIDLGKEALYITFVKCRVCGAVILIRFGPAAIDGTPEHRQYHIDRGDVPVAAED
jgi:hypothetical protein